LLSEYSDICKIEKEHSLRMEIANKLKEKNIDNKIIEFATGIELC
jgi:hypothetical protein